MSFLFSLLDSNCSDRPGRHGDSAVGRKGILINGSQPKVWNGNNQRSLHNRQLCHSNLITIRLVAINDLKEVKIRIIIFLILVFTWSISRLLSPSKFNWLYYLFIFILASADPWSIRCRTSSDGSTSRDPWKSGPDL